MLVLGDMKELGEESTAYHQEVVDKVRENGWADVVLIGEEFGKATKPDQYMHFPDVEAFRDQYPLHSFQWKHILLKGSRSMRLESWLDQEKS
jgi:UDP-N-acetylmuramoyl-tripeptide--D-alanyl-D-alanine ligase